MVVDSLTRRRECRIPLRARDKHARRRLAVLAGVGVAGVNALDHGGFQVGIGKDDVGGFAAQFLRDALDRIRRELGHP